MCDRECVDHTKWDSCRVEKMGCPGCYYFQKMNEASCFDIILESDQEEYEKECYGSDILTITLKDIEALLAGKQLACYTGQGLEYAIFIKLNKEGEEN